MLCDRAYEDDAGETGNAVDAVWMLVAPGIFSWAEMSQVNWVKSGQEYIAS